MFRIFYADKDTTLYESYPEYNSQKLADGDSVTDLARVPDVVEEEDSEK